MPYREEANKVVVHAETDLRSLAERALSERAYADVAHIVSLADSLRGLSERTDAGAAAPPALANNTPRRSRAASRRNPLCTKGPARARRGYPRFERDGDKLVKIGWSKKCREEYEHRASRGAVEAFAQYLTSNVQPGKTFLVEDILPVSDGADGELPSYQVYLTLAWLRDLGAVKKLGREGYVLQGSMASNGDLEELWKRTEARHP